jgi:hypothetical protein
MLTMLSAFRAKDRLLKSLPELQIHATQLARDGSPPPGLRLPHAKLSRNSNQIARGRIRRFESDMPSQPVWSLERHPGGTPYIIARLIPSWEGLILLSQKVAANGEQNHLFGKIHTSAMGGWNGSAKIE